MHADRPRSSRRGLNYWVFTCNPETYRIDEAIAERDIAPWNLDRGEIRPGDRVAIWRTAGKGGLRGVIALGEVVKRPAEAGDPAEYASYWVTPPREPMEGQIWLRYVRPARGPLWLQDDRSGVLSSLGIARLRGSHVRRIEPEPWNRIVQAMGGWTKRGKGQGGPIARLVRSKQEKSLANPSTFDPNDVDDIPEKVAASIVRRQGQPQFRRQLLEAYEGRCAISGCDVEEALEAAHIFPYKGSATSQPANGLPLRADLHTLFDLGLLTIDAGSLAVVLSPRLRGTQYEVFSGNKLRAPIDPSFAPSRKALQHHRHSSRL